ncbi:MAG TPA: DNA repair protein RecO [Clostridia bacterium]|jgi:DNA repair protein RecO (recombination protein O)|nr:DNA repair protein RecO [Clostridia bacterium]
MRLYKTETLVLRSVKYREADSLLTLLTKEKGKVKAIAKGVRKINSRLRGGVQLFTHNQMLLYHGRNLHTVTQSECLEAFAPLQKNMATLTAACYWCELLDTFLPWEEKESDLFALALAGFHLIALENSSLVIRGLEIKLLAALGYQPILNHCVVCGQALKEGQMIFFSPAGGGTLCAHCQTEVGLSLTWEVLKTWQLFQEMPFSKFMRLKISQGGLEILNRLLEKYLEYQLDYPLKSRTILEKMWLG